MTTATTEHAAARALTTHAAAMAEPRPGRPALPAPIARTCAAWQVDGGIAADLVVGRGRLAAAVADAREELRSGRWADFRDRAAALGPLDPGATLADPGPCDPRPVVARLREGDRLAYRAVLASADLGRLAAPADDGDRHVAAAMRAIGGAVVADAAACHDLARALLRFASLAMRDWRQARDHARAERVAGGDWR